MGFGFIKYEDQRSTILAVDNMNGTELLGKILRVDHKDNYVAPKKSKKELEEMAERGEKDDRTYRPGRAYEGKELASEYNITKGVNIFNPNENEKEESDEIRIKREMEGRKKEEDRRKKEEENIQRFKRKLEKRRLENKKKIESSKHTSDLANGIIYGWRGRNDPAAKKITQKIEVDYEVCESCGKKGHKKIDCPLGGDNSHIAGINRVR